MKVYDLWAYIVRIKPYESYILCDGTYGMHLQSRSKYFSDGARSLARRKHAPAHTQKWKTDVENVGLVLNMATSSLTP